MIMKIFYRVKELVRCLNINRYQFNFFYEGFLNIKPLFYWAFFFCITEISELG
jgi:hypothetical protein